MTQLVEESTASTVASGYRLANPTGMGRRHWFDYIEPLDVDSEGDLLLSPSSHVVFLTSASDPDIRDWISSNATGGWKILQIPLTHDRVSSLWKPTIWYEPFGATGANQGVRDLADAFSSTGRSPARKTGAVSIALKEDRTVSEGSAQTWDSELRSLLLEERLASYIRYLVREAVDEVFTDGMESVFSHRLTRTIEDYGDTAVLAIEKLMGLDQVNVEVAGEILRQLGSMEDPRAHHSRLAILVANLLSPDPRIRDAASLGLAALDDPEAISDIQKALDREPSSLLRRNLKLVMDQLQSTQ